jgi:hypothetical protein
MCQRGPQPTRGRRSGLPEPGEMPNPGHTTMTMTMKIVAPTVTHYTTRHTIYILYSVELRLYIRFGSAAACRICIWLQPRVPHRLYLYIQPTAYMQLCCVTPQHRLT